MEVMNKFNEGDFKEHYKQAPSYFKTQYGKEVQKLLEQICKDERLFDYILFCNDNLKIQPCYLFWVVYKDYLKEIFNKEENEEYINRYIKKENVSYNNKLKLFKDWRSRSIGAWFGYVMKFILNYDSVPARYCPNNGICNKAAYFEPRSEDYKYKYWNDEIIESFNSFKNNTI